MAGYVSPVWNEEGPAPITLRTALYSKAAGAIHAIAADQLEIDRVFVATVGGGVWRSHDAASAVDPTWVPLTDFQPSLSMSAIAFSPLDATRDTLYAGCGRMSHTSPLVGANGGPLLGLLKTTNGGASWSELGRADFSGQSVMRLAPLPLSTATGDVILAATDHRGLLRSENGGATWRKVGGFGGVTTDIAVDPLDAHNVYVASAGRLYLSTDAGDAAWDDVTPTGWDKVQWWSNVRLSFSPVADGLGHHWLYVSAPGAGWFYTDHVGGDFTAITGPPDGSHAAGNIVASAEQYNCFFADSDSGSPNHWLGTVTVNGQSTQWERVEASGANNTGPHTDARDWVFSADPSLMFESDDGGIYRLHNPHNVPALGPRRWNEAVGNLRIAEFHSIAYDHVNHTIFGATQDNAIPHQTTPHDIRWALNEDAWGDGFQVGVDNLTTPGSSIHYSSQQNLFHFIRQNYATPSSASSSTGLGLVITGTGGHHYNEVEGALTADNPNDLGSVRWNQSWAVNAVQPNRLLLGTDYLYESFDRGDTFQSLGGLAQNRTGDWMPTQPVGRVSAYAYGHLQNADLIYLGAGGKLLLRTSSSGLPTVIGEAAKQGGTYPGSTPVGIAVGPTDWRVAYILDDQSQIWRTSDGGATDSRWVNLTGNLAALTPDHPPDLRTLAAVPPQTTGGLEMLLVGGVGGVFIAVQPSGQSTHWAKYGQNLPNAVVTDLHYDLTDDVLVVGTLGRGAWSVRNVASTLATRPTVKIHTGATASCVVDFVEHTTIRFTAAVSDISDLVAPVSYDWTVTGGVLNSSSGNTAIVEAGDAGQQLRVTVVVTDGLGLVLSTFVTRPIITFVEASLRERWCQIVGGLVPPWRQHPAGPDPGPWEQSRDTTWIEELPHFEHAARELVDTIEEMIAFHREN